MYFYTLIDRSNCTPVVSNSFVVSSWFDPMSRCPFVETHKKCHALLSTCQSIAFPIDHIRPLAMDILMNILIYVFKASLQCARLSSTQLPSPLLAVCSFCEDCFVRLMFLVLSFVIRALTVIFGERIDPNAGRVISRANSTTSTYHQTIFKITDEQFGTDLVTFQQYSKRDRPWLEQCRRRCRRRHGSLSSGLSSPC